MKPQILVLSTSARFFSLNLEKEMAGREFTRMDSLDAFIASDRRSIPFLLIMEVAVAEDVDRALLAHEWAERVDPRAPARFLLLAAKHITLGDRAAKLRGVEIGFLPLNNKNLCFKVDLQVKLLEATVAELPPEGFFPEDEATGFAGEFVSLPGRPGRVMVLKGPRRGNWRRELTARAAVRWRWIDEEPGAPPEEKGAEAVTRVSWAAESDAPPTYDAVLAGWVLDGPSPDVKAFRGEQEIYSARKIFFAREEAAAEKSTIAGRTEATGHGEDRAFARETDEGHSGDVRIRRDDVARAGEIIRHGAGAGGDTAEDEPGAGRKEAGEDGPREVRDARRPSLSDVTATPAGGGRGPALGEALVSLAKTAATREYEERRAKEEADYLTGGAVSAASPGRPGAADRSEAPVPPGRGPGAPDHLKDLAGVLHPDLPEEIHEVGGDDPAGAGRLTDARTTAGRAPGIYEPPAFGREPADEALRSTGGEAYSDLLTENVAVAGGDSARAVVGAEPAAGRVGGRGTGKETESSDRFSGEGSRPETRETGGEDSADGSAAGARVAEGEGPAAGGAPTGLAGRGNERGPAGDARVRATGEPGRHDVLVKGAEAGRETTLLASAAGERADGVRIARSPRGSPEGPAPSAGNLAEATEGPLLTRVSYVMTCAELGDENSSWLPAGKYRIYLSARHRYYGYRNEVDLFPAWAYEGELAPEFLEAEKAWRFYDRRPEVYFSRRELPPLLGIDIFRLVSPAAGSPAAEEMARRAEAHRRGVTSGGAGADGAVAGAGEAGGGDDGRGMLASLVRFVKKVTGG